MYRVNRLCNSIVNKYCRTVQYNDVIIRAPIDLYHFFLSGSPRFDAFQETNVVVLYYVLTKNLPNLRFILI